MDDWPPHMVRRYGKNEPEFHAPQFAEIEQIMREVGVKLYQVIPENTLEEYTAYCVSVGHHFLININSAKQFLISVERYDRILIAAHEQLATKAYVDAIVGGRPMLTARWFSMYESGFFEELALYLREQRVLSLTKYWIVRMKLWWNK